MREGLNTILAEGPERIDERLRPLVRELRAGLAERGLDLLTPAGEEFASGIVAFTHHKPEWLGAELARQNVIVWAGDGRVRVSVHLYNNAADIGSFFAALDRVGKSS